MNRWCSCLLSIICLRHFSFTTLASKRPVDLSANSMARRLSLSSMKTRGSVSVRLFLELDDDGLELDSRLALLERLLQLRRKLGMEYIFPYPLRSFSSLELERLEFFHIKVWFDVTFFLAGVARSLQQSFFRKRNEYMSAQDQHEMQSVSTRFSWIH